MATTRTGSIPIGMRCNSAWMSDPDEVIPFAIKHDFACIDTGAWEPEKIKAATDQGLSIGTVDLPQPWENLASNDPAIRSEAADRCVEYITSIYDSGVRIFFACALMGNEDTDRKTREENAIEGFGRLCEGIAKLPDGGARIVLEGWPGPGPHFPVLACTPEGCRRLIQGTGAANLGINFDPSHLIRMGIDSVRFAEEFAQHVFHIHGKDTEMIEEGQYEYGTLQEPIEAPTIPYGGTYWRYTIPGHGCARWTKLLNILCGADYKGYIGIELEDMHYNGSTSGEKRGLIASRQFLENV